MTLRQRLALGAALAVTLSVATGSLAAYVAVRSNLRADIDSALEDAPPQDFRGDGDHHGPQGGVPVISRFVDTAGNSRGDLTLPYDSQTLAVAARTRDDYFSDAEIGGQPYRLYTRATQVVGVALIQGRQVGEIQNALGRLKLVLLTVTGGGLLLGAVLGWLTSGRALAPVRRFTAKTESIAGAPDLSQRLDVTSNDELGRLATSFNTTLDSLERSADAQRQLVADASHELRTPLASLRTNIEVLQRGSALGVSDREELLSDVVTQTDELTNLVGDVVDIAGRGETTDYFQDLSLDEIVEAALVRVRRLAPQLEFVGEVEPWVVRGSPERLTRLVANLLDNATKWSPPGGRVEVGLHRGELSVRDHGPGIDPKDLPHIFDRFYRADAARSLPGSGLGLAIVRQVAEAHSATPVVENAEGRGARVSVRFPAAP